MFSVNRENGRGYPPELDIQNSGKSSPPIIPSPTRSPKLDAFNTDLLNISINKGFKLLSMAKENLNNKDYLNGLENYKAARKDFDDAMKYVTKSDLSDEQQTEQHLILLEHHINAELLAAKLHKNLSNLEEAREKAQMVLLITVNNIQKFAQQREEANELLSSTPFSSRPVSPLNLSSQSSPQSSKRSSVTLNSELLSPLSAHFPKTDLI